MITALSSGGLGDIVYSLPILKELKVNRLYVKTAYYHPPYGNLHSAIQSFIESEGIECHAYPYVPLYQYPIPVTYDIDTFRLQRERGRIHIQVNMRKTFSLPQRPFGPWLSLPVKDEGYTVIHLTERWRENSRINWKQILFDLQGKVYFTGFQHEWLDFCTRYGNVEWYPTNDILEMAELIAGCSALYCNQSVSLAIAQGLGKKYYLEKKPGKTNTIMYTQNEHIL